MSVYKQPSPRTARTPKVVVAGLVLAIAPLVAGCGSVERHKQVPISRLSAPRRALHPPPVWDPSGVDLPPATVPGWHRVFADNFAHDLVPVDGFSGCSWPAGIKILQLHCAGLDGYPRVDRKWFSYPDGWQGRPSSGTYFPSDVVSIRRGVMTMHLHTAFIDGRPIHMLAAMVPKIPGGSGRLGGMLYGRYVIRARFDSLHGYRVSFLLWPDSNNFVKEGLISFPDAPLDAPYVNGFMHHRGATSTGQQDSYRTPAVLGSWHTYEIDWTPTSCSFYLDGRRIGASTNRSLIPNTPMHLVLQTDVSPTVSVPPNNVQGNVQVDWVAVYAPTR